MPKGKKKIEDVNKEEEKQKIRSGNWCLKFGNWVPEVQEDDLCVAGGMPMCSDCIWASWNITVKGRPLDDMPKPIYLSSNYEEDGNFVECPHGSWWMKRHKSIKPDDYEWICIDGYEGCKCKSS